MGQNSNPTLFSFTSDYVFYVKVIFLSMILHDNYDLLVETCCPGLNQIVPGTVARYNPTWHKSQHRVAPEQFVKDTHKRGREDLEREKRNVNSGGKDSKN